MSLNHRQTLIMFILWCCFVYSCGRLLQMAENTQSWLRPDYPWRLQYFPLKDWKENGTPAKLKTIQKNHTFLKYEVDLLIKKYAKQYGHSTSLIQSLIKYESLSHPKVNFDYAKARVVRSHAGAVGFMQIMPIHARLKGLPVSALENPDLNIKLGCAILAEQKRIAQSRGLKNIIAEGLRQYNQGPGSTKTWIAHRSHYKNWYKYVFPIMNESGVQICQL